MWSVKKQIVGKIVCCHHFINDVKSPTYFHQEITQLRENIAKCFKKLTKIDTNIKCMEKEEHCLR